MANLFTAPDAPSQPSDISMSMAMNGLQEPVLQRGLDVEAAGFIDGPVRFVGHQVNPYTVHNLQIAQMEIDGVIANGMNNHEGSPLFSLMVHREDFGDKHVLMTPYEMNLLFEQLHRQALRTWQEEMRTTSTAQLTQNNLRRLIVSNRNLEMLKFLSVKEMLRVVYFVGVQFGNRFNSGSIGPGVAVITSGSAQMRNTCLNELTSQQDQIYVSLKPRDSNGALSLQMHSYKVAGGPSLSQLSFVDLGGCAAYGAAYKIGHIASKWKEDMPTENIKRTASGLQGTVNEMQYAELSAPLTRVVLTTCGMKAYNVV